MTTINQGMSVEEIKQFVAQRMANAIEAIAIYETKTNMAHKTMSQAKRQEDKVAENATNKKKWEGNQNGSSSQQNKGHKVPRAHTTRLINNKAYAGSLLLCNQCKFHHNGPCTVKCGNCKKSRVDLIHRSGIRSKPKIMQDAIGFAIELMDKKISTLAERQAKNKRNLDNNNQDQQQSPKNGQCTIKCANCKRVGHLTRDCMSPAATKNQRNLTCYEWGNQGHYKSDIPELKNRNHENQVEGTRARGMMHALEGGENNQDLNDMKDDINALFL
nr:reverse transcriptase domain-containing protein [Tanacetum cinerariifolium]